jgi:diguanylate cyclase (GGDEF)-like protein
VLQPVIGLKAREIAGYEGLIRGPAGSPLHAPRELFAAAAQAGLGAELERLSQLVVITTFSQLGLPGKLFLNVSPSVFTGQNGDGGDPLPASLARLGLPPERVIIELTENEPTLDFTVMRRATDHYRALGFEVAIDDLGEGFASLRLWSELHPEFVKLDMHFTQGVSQDPLKLQFVKAVQQIAETCGTRVIAEGIETKADLRVIRDLGIAYGQGYFFARPSATPAVEIPLVARQALVDFGIAVYPEIGRSGGRKVTLHRLLLEVEPVAPDHENEAVYTRFDANPELGALPVVRDGVPVGLINRHNLIDRFARPFRRELYGRRPCSMFMDAEPLTVDVDMSIQELSAKVVEADRRHLASGFIITDQGRYLGVATGHDLIREITLMQLTAARYANPLTLLPGNVPITEHLGRLLEAEAPFSACHCDLDNFKPYNDVYGYQKGDDIIVLAARVLSGACDPEHDFIGHVGGDDFILLFQSPDWERRCEAALDQFGAAIRSVIGEEGSRHGGFASEDRRGEPVFYSYPTLSIGAVAVEPGSVQSHLDVSSAAAEAKRQAKRIAGNSLFIERRRLRIGD